MKRTLSILCLSFCWLASASLAEPASPVDQLAAAIKEVQTQQAQLAENQAKIDTKLATVLEAVRVARIYSSRAGH